MRTTLLSLLVLTIASACGEQPTPRASADDLEVFAREAENAGGDFDKACLELERLCREHNVGCGAHDLFCKRPQDICQRLKSECDGGSVDACKTLNNHCHPGDHGDGAVTRPDGSKPDGAPPPRPDGSQPPRPDGSAPPHPDSGTPPAPDSGIPPGTPPPGADTKTPFPIDRGDDPQTPGTYKGLPLRLVNNGKPTVSAVDGVIGVICIGMSNSNQECADYIGKAQGTFAAQINKAVRIVNCAVGGHAIEKWNDPQYDAQLWSACINTKLKQAGVRLDQVRVVYHKAADQFTTDSGGQAYPPYPAANSDYNNFTANLSTFAGRVTKFFTNLQAVYNTSRMYGGFSSNAGRGEPLSYEEGHALNSWLAKNKTVGGVWFGWGPYIWAGDCNGGDKNASGVCYVRSDYQADGVHPAQGAKDKISQMIHDRFKQEAWYTP